MYLRSAGLCAALALVADAILIPPTVSVKGLGSDVQALYPEDFFTKPRVIKTSCPGCNFKTAEVNVEETDNAGSDLIHTLGIDTDRNEVVLDKATVFPPRIPSESMYVHAAPPNTDPAQYLEENPNLPGLQVNEYVVVLDNLETVSDDGFELLLLTVSLNQIENKRVNQGIRILLGKDAEGKLSIVNYQPVNDEEEHAIPSPHKSDESGNDASAGELCASSAHPLLCKWRQIIIAKIRVMKAGIKKHHGKPCGRPSRLHRPKEYQHGRHRHHHHGHNRHRLHPFVKFLIIPIIGFAVATAIYFMGWFVGTSVAFIYLFFARSRRNGYSRISLNENDMETPGDDDGDESLKDGKDLYMVEDIEAVEGEAPPLYTEVAGEDGKN